MAHKGNVGGAGEGCGSVVRKPILGPFGPDTGSIRNEPELTIFVRAGQDLVEIPQWRR